MLDAYVRRPDLFDALAAFAALPQHIYPDVDLPPLPAWHADAACADVDDVDWFPEAPSRGVKPDYRLPLAVCRRCPVRASCLDEALRDGLVDGVWGGVTPELRRTVRLLGVE